MRLVQDGIWAVMLGLVEILRPGETTRGTPEDRTAGRRVRRVVRAVMRIRFDMLEKLEYIYPQFCG